MAKASPLLLLILAIPLQSCDTSVADEGHARPPPVTAALLGHSEEAVAFLGRPDAVLWIDELPQQELRALVGRMFEAGMPGARCAAIEDLDGTRIASRIVLQLPLAGDARERVLTVYNQFAIDHARPAVADVGQDVLILP